MADAHFALNLVETIGILLGISPRLRKFFIGATNIEFIINCDLKTLKKTIFGVDFISQVMKKLREARKDVDAALCVWKELINERLSEQVAYSYVKGSALKRWDTLVDYVPTLSDIDIHLGTFNYQPLFPQNREGFHFSLEITKLYEERFKEKRPMNLHIPRPQIVVIEEHQTELLPECVDEILPLIGEIPYKDEETEYECQLRDLTSLRKLGDLLEKLPIRVIDRIGLEYFRILRELCWVVSPTPVRVLSQFSDSKMAWKQNRTNVIHNIKEIGLSKLANIYKSYYLKGWEAFERGFTDNQIMRELLRLAYDVLWLSFETVCKEKF